MRADSAFQARAAEAMHVDVDDLAQFAHQELDVDSGPAVHLRGVLPSQQVHPESPVVGQ